MNCVYFINSFLFALVIIAKALEMEIFCVHRTDSIKNGHCKSGRQQNHEKAQNLERKNVMPSPFYTIQRIVSEIQPCLYISDLS